MTNVKRCRTHKYNFLDFLKLIVRTSMLYYNRIKSFEIIKKKKKEMYYWKSYDHILFYSYDSFVNSIL